MTRTVLKESKKRNKRLRNKSTVVTKFDDSYKKLVRDLLDTMKTLRGLGIAAPQIGVSKRLFVMQALEKDLYIITNPVIIKKSEEMVDSIEACLSVPRKAGLVKRHKQLTVEYQDVKGEPKKAVVYGEEAKIFQHELNHLDGILFIDIAEKVWKI